ncbi:MAG: hypothetical protein WA693_22630, partial [Pseudolabrys sp.]
LRRSAVPSCRKVIHHFARHQGTPTTILKSPDDETVCEARHSAIENFLGSIQSHCGTGNTIIIQCGYTDTRASYAHLKNRKW